MMKSIFKTFFLSLCIIANTHFAYSQTASILPQGKTQFLDNNAKPLTSGTVDFYIPSTSTRKTTWQNSGETIANTNPVVLDAGGRAIIYGDGSYRMVVKDRLGNLIYDQVTSSTGSGSSASTATGDGDLVGTIKPWAGMTAPNQYMFTYGQEVSRTTYSALYTAITSSQAVFCNSGSAVLNGLVDTTNFWVGMSVEVTCVAAGFTTIISKTASTVTMAVNANVTTNATAIFYPWGRGNGTTTFNLPDLRGATLVGNNIMGGVSGSNLTATYFGTTDPNSTGAFGGAQSKTITTGNQTTDTPGGNITITGTSQPGTNVYTPRVSGNIAISAFNGSTASAISAGAGINVYSTTQQGSLDSGTWTFTGIPQRGGIATSSTIVAAGSGYTNGSQTITVSGGTCTTQPQFTVTVAGNVFTGTPALLTAGSCTVTPTNPVATTGGGGTGGTLNVLYTPLPFSLVQPSVTTNYIIKVTPDTNSASASGVTSLGSMTGDIACGSGTLCTGNTISVVSPAIALTVGTTPVNSGTTTRVLFDNAGVLGEYPISGTVSVAMTTGATLTSPILITPTIGVATGTSLALGGCTIGASVFCTTGNSVLGGSLTITSASATALAVGLTGSTNSAFTVDASTASQVAGLKVTGAATGGTVAVVTTDSGSNNNLTVNAKGTGTINVGGVSTGLVSIGGGGGGASVSNGLTVSTTETINMGADNLTGLTINGAAGNSRLTLGSDATPNALVRSQNSGQLKLGINTTDSAALESNGLFSVGINASTLGQLKLYGNTSGNTILRPAATASGTLTLPAATDTLIGKATTDILTNKTYDSAGAGNVMQVSGVTISRGQFPGTNTNDSATAGNIGEFVSSTVASGSAVALTSATPANITSISLTAGDWDVTGTASFTGATTTTVTIMIGSFSTTSATLDATDGRLISHFYTGAAVYNTVLVRHAMPTARFSLSGTTTVFLVAQSTFAVSTSGAFGILEARRAR